MTIKQLAHETGYHPRTIRNKIRSNQQLLQRCPTLKEIFGGAGGKDGRRIFYENEWIFVRNAFGLK